MYLSLYQIKKHLNISDEWKDDDEYLCDLAIVAEATVEKHIDCKLSDLAKKNGGELPSPLLHAMFLLIGNFYANRESVTYAQAKELPLGYEYLLSLYKDYSRKEENQCKRDF